MYRPEFISHGAHPRLLTGTEALSRDLKIENFDLSVSGAPLLVSASLGVAYGRRYGLVGRNGAGKSTLLKALSLRELPNVPEHLSLLHVEQEVEGDDTPAITSVLAADTERYVFLHTHTYRHLHYHS